ncbi:MAG: hybrid sensor histidine kinase/response regulator [Magnetococcus sp. DMHC-6]
MFGFSQNKSKPQHQIEVVSEKKCVPAPNDEDNISTTSNPILENSRSIIDVDYILKSKQVFQIAYQMRTTLESVVGLLQEVVNDSNGGITGWHLNHVKDSFIHVKNLDPLVDELLNISKPSEDRIVLNKEFFDAYYLIQEIRRELSGLARSRKVIIVNRIKESTRLYADPFLFKEILRKLIFNAIKFSPQEKEVIIYTPNNLLTTVAIWDQGPGLSPQVLQTIFEYRATSHNVEEKVLRERENGLFGLPFCCRIMEAHEGKLDVQTKEGEGTVFSMTLPHIRPFVLAVDDEKRDQDLLSMFLGSLDVEVALASNGEGALSWIQSQSKMPDLIITDISMPKMDGFLLLQHLTSDPKTCHIPIMMVAGTAEVEQRVKAFRLGATDFTVKPIVPQDFLPRVRRLLG